MVMPNLSKIYLEESMPKCLKCYYQIARLRINLFFPGVKKSLLKDGMIKGTYFCVVKYLVLLKENI